MKLDLTADARDAIERAGEEPFSAINTANGISADAFCSLLDELLRFICTFEEAIGLQSARSSVGERLHEAIRAKRATVEQHLADQYFSLYLIPTDTAYILLENYELERLRLRLTRSYQGYNFTVLRFLLTRVAHEDTHAHLLRTDYARLFAELVDRTEARLKEAQLPPRVTLQEAPEDLTAPMFLKEREEVAARNMQRFALNAYLKEFYERDPARYGLLGVPLFLPPHPEVVAEMKRVTHGTVVFRSGFVSSYRRVLAEYVGAIASSKEGIHESARRYLHSRTKALIAQAQQCVEGDYSGVKARECERVWRPGRGMKV
ncbi:MAG TPA: hypothetical protein ENN68_02880 [Methanomicrobia archaeon]|nr:hypothetical protein [Methanomicrobia archaeon]